MPEINQIQVGSTTYDIRDSSALSQSAAETLLAGKSDVGHDHDSDYAAIVHDHDSDYAAIGHDHDSNYASINHDHDSDYADISHTHDDRYYTESEIDTLLSGISGGDVSGCVAKTGDTMSGTLAFSGTASSRYVSSSIDMTAAPQTEQNRTAVIWRDSNENNAGSIRLVQTTENKIGIGLYAKGGTEYPLIKGFLDTSNNVSYELGDGGAFCDAAGALKKSGGTMTGNLDIDHDIRIHSNAVTYGTAPGSDVWGTSLRLCPGSNDTTGVARVIYRNTGVNELHLAAQNKNGSNTAENYLRLGVKNDGTLSVSVADSVIWRKALGLGTNGALPITLAQGGTGGTDGGWQSITNSSVFAGTIYYRKIGFLVILLSNGINLKSDLTGDNTSIQLYSGTNAMKPSKATYTAAGKQYADLGWLYINTSGAITFYKPNALKTWPTTYGIVFETAYYAA